MLKRLRIAYLTASDPDNPHSWSGIHYSAITELKKHFESVTALGPHEEKGIVLRGRVYSKLISLIQGKRFDYLHSIKLARAYGKYFSEQLKKKEYDLVFAVAASTELAFLETDLPIFYTADATFANMVDYYPYYSKLTRRSLQEGNEVQQLALDKCTKLIFPSDWAASSASGDYRAAENKIHVVPFGANLKEVPIQYTNPEISIDKQVNLLFVGVEWERKGGPVALEAFRDLRKRGLDVKLTIVGCNPDVSDEGVEIIPFINKKVDAERKRLNDLFANAHFFILPTQAECFGLVFCEASAFGTPSLAPHTGGVRSAIDHAQNGFLFSPFDKPGDYADKIEILMKHPMEYGILRKRCRAVYDAKLNWTAWGNAVAEIISATQSR